MCKYITRGKPPTSVEDKPGGISVLSLAFGFRILVRLNAPSPKIGELCPFGSLALKVEKRRMIINQNSSIGHPRMVFPLTSLKQKRYSECRKPGRPSLAGTLTQPSACPPSMSGTQREGGGSGGLCLESAGDSPG